jgi:hypothetical protein
MENGKTGFLGECRRASALVWLVVIVLLAFVVYGVGRWVESRTPDPDTAQGLMPWKEWRIREKSKKPADEPRVEHAKITTTLKYDANVELPETHDPRGEVIMWISPQGQVWGAWSGNYTNTKKENCDIQAGKFEGRVYPGKIYRDTKGEDLSKLYFLMKGKFLIHESDLKQKYHIHDGDIYVNGWLDPDLSVISEITITSDEKYFETFSWKAGPVKTE